MTHIKVLEMISKILKSMSIAKDMSTCTMVPVHVISNLLYIDIVTRELVSTTV